MRLFRRRQRPAPPSSDPPMDMLPPRFPPSFPRLVPPPVAPPQPPPTINVHVHGFVGDPAALAREISKHVRSQGGLNPRRLA